MTMSTGGVPATKPVELPEPGFPMLTRMISDTLFPSTHSQTIGCPHCSKPITIDRTADKEEPVTWIVGQRHPLVPEMKVMRMFVDRGGVEVYSVSDDAKAGMRNLVPMSKVRLIEEAMPLDVFVDELVAAESDEPDDPDGGDPEPEPLPAVITTNGQNAPS
jgi:hypothetical protein